jgi:hypothetical protein
MLELFVRLKTTGQTDDMPLTQELIGDALGLIARALLRKSCSRISEIRSIGERGASSASGSRNSRTDLVVIFSPPAGAGSGATGWSPSRV